MAGLVTGLAMAEALAGLPANIDRELARRLLAAAETAYVAAFQRRHRDDNPEGLNHAR